MSEDSQTYKPNKIILHGADGEQELSLVKMHGLIVPTGHLWMYEDVYDYFKSKLKGEVYSLFNELENRILEEYSCQIDYELALESFGDKGLTLTSVFNKLNEFALGHFGYNTFHAEIMVNCSKEVNGDMQFWGAVINLGYWVEHWLHIESDTTYPIWFFNINDFKIMLDQSIDKESRNLILELISVEIREQYKLN